MEGDRPGLNYAILTDDTGLFVSVVIWLRDCSEEGNLTSGLGTDDAFVVAGRVGQEAIVWSGNLQYAHTCSVPTW